MFPWELVMTSLLISIEQCEGVAFPHQTVSQGIGGGRAKISPTPNGDPSDPHFESISL